MSDNIFSLIYEDIINRLPNSVSGDGKTYASAVKKALQILSESISRSFEQFGEGAVAVVSGLEASEWHTTDANGMPRTDIVITFSSKDIEKYKHSQVWVKDNSDGSTWSQAGTTNEGKFTIEDVRHGLTYTVKVVSVNVLGGSSNFEISPTVSITVQGGTIIPDAPSQITLSWSKDGALWEWEHNDDGYIQFFELRLDSNVGVYDNKLLSRTSDRRSNAIPSVRSGVAYLYARNIFEQYSEPIMLEFSKPAPAKPSNPAITSTLNGVQITMDTLPDGCNGYVLDIDGVEYTTNNSQYAYNKASGTATIKYCFTDPIGRGEFSDAVTVAVQTQIDSGQIATGVIKQTLIGTAAHGETVTFSHAFYGVPNVAVALSDLKAYDVNSNVSDIYITAEAQNITASTCLIQCYAYTLIDGVKTIVGTGTATYIATEK